ncbi:hypothetical protein NGM10_02945 [Halorussus salilacus]|uniref:hypothetical protein n=1 Tax=Halorussus salilacus TaxID=2953750 RepID=UPI00209E8134|nr:hypothetical protein [Halorussus salilacus]USZ68704.1 hypothetical protein NGM10_02945 [Halorussus salilacus]
MRITTKIARVVGAVGPEPEGVYECEDCGARFDLDRQRCPDCEGYSIDRVDWLSALSE